MVDLAWPADLAPYKVAFYLQPHVGGQESPITRTRKVYGLSAPRWIARLTFRGGCDGLPVVGDQSGFGARLDALIADLDGGLNNAVFHDWRRPRPARALSVTGALLIAAAPAGATSITVTGFAPRSAALSIGDYVGGDGRPHLVSAAATIAAGGVVSGAGTLMANATGAVVVGIKPPLCAPIAAGTSLRWPVTGRFQLVGEDAGQNEAEVGQPVEYTLDFVEALS